MCGRCYISHIGEVCCQSQVHIIYIFCVRCILRAVQSHMIINQKGMRKLIPLYLLFRYVLSTCLFMYTASATFDYYCSSLSCTRIPVLTYWGRGGVISVPGDGSLSTWAIIYSMIRNYLSARPLASVMVNIACGAPHLQVVKLVQSSSTWPLDGATPYVSPGAVAVLNPGPQPWESYVLPTTAVRPRLLFSPSVWPGSCIKQLNPAS